MYESTYVLGKMEGKEEGYYQNQCQTVVLAYQQGMSLDLIANITLLSLDNIKLITG